LLGSKGIAIALADGISSSEVGHLASESAIKSFLDDYYCTSEAWSVKSSRSRRVLTATNAWLYAQTQEQPVPLRQGPRPRVHLQRASIIKSTTALMSSISATVASSLLRGRQCRTTDAGSSRRRQRGQELSQPRLGHPARSSTSIIAPLQVEEGDVFILATDGVHELRRAEAFVHRTLAKAWRRSRPPPAAIAAEAFERGSTDNLTVQTRAHRRPAPSGEIGELLAATGRNCRCRRCSNRE
jgi:serine/threonine protein phosphatase PrpC